MDGRSWNRLVDMRSVVGWVVEEEKLVEWEKSGRDRLEVGRGILMALRMVVRVWAGRSEWKSDLPAFRYLSDTCHLESEQRRDNNRGWDVEE